MFAQWGSPRVVLLLVLLAGGVAARFVNLQYPATLVFDEHHFVENARNYLAHRGDWNDHPPLGKLVLAASMRALGDNALGWRLPSLSLGLLTIVVAALAAARLFRSREVGLVAAALVAADGAFIVYSRTALLDGQLVFLQALALLVVTRRWNLVTSLMAGAVLGLACSVKFSGVGLLVLFGAALLLDETSSWRQRITFALVIGGVGVAAYFGFYALGLWVADQPSGLSAVWANTQRLLQHHSGLTEMKHASTSGWATWFVPIKPIVFLREEHLGAMRMVTMLGNIAIWWAASATFFISMGLVLRDGVRRVAEWPNGKAMLLLLAAALGFLAPWVLSHRDSYAYHYLPSYLALVMLLSGALVWARERVATPVLIYLCVVTVVAALYVPLWCAVETRAGVVDALLFIRSWR